LKDFSFRDFSLISDFLKKLIETWELGCGSSGRVPAHQLQGPELNPSTTKKKENIMQIIAYFYDI
jgi:hypothetical protein